MQSQHPNISIKKSFPLELTLALLACPSQKAEPRGCSDNTESDAVTEQLGLPK